MARRNQAPHLTEGDFRVSCSARLFQRSWEMNLVIQPKWGSMPNGRSGGFRISVAQCRELLEGLPCETRIGQVIGFFGPKGVTIAKLAQRLDGYKEVDFFVEEQDHKWYIAHLGAGPKGWIVIKEDSPLHEGFRSSHAEWLTRSPVEEQGL
jgi:hypothetical protein